MKRPVVLSHNTSITMNLEGNTWIMTEKGITCQTCPKSETGDDDDDTKDQFGLSNFDELDIRGIFDINIKSGDEYAVELIGSDDEKKKYKIFRSGETLVVEYEGGNREI